MAIKLMNEVVKTEEGSKSMWVHQSLGMALLSSEKDRKKGIYHLRKAVEIEPTHVQLRYNYALALRNSGEDEEAMKEFESVLASQPNLVEANYKLAQLYNRHDRVQESLQLLNRAILLHPKKPHGYVYRASIWNNRKHFKNALSDYEKALAMLQDSPEAKMNPSLLQLTGDVLVSKGITLSNMKRSEEALASYQHALADFPDDMWIDREENEITAPPIVREGLAGIWRASNAITYWKDWSKWRNLLVAVTHLSMKKKRYGKNVSEKERASPFEPYVALSLPGPFPPGFMHRIARSHVAAAGYLRSLSDIDFDGIKTSISKTRKLKIGYISRRFEEYPGTQLMLQIFALHNRAQYEVFAFASGPDDESSERKMVRREVDYFIDISDLRSSEEMASAIRSEKIDVLIDYDGNHSFNNLSILSKRPAPIQVTWLGFAGTSGAGSFYQSGFIDYIIVDKIVTPPHSTIVSKFAIDELKIETVQKQHFSERLVYLPHVYQPQNTAQHIEVKLFQNLDGKHSNFVFVCFNRKSKISPKIFDTWMKIMKRVPRSILWLYNEDKISKENLQKEAEARGISRQRLHFAKRLSKGEHLGRHQFGDLFLDTLTYGAHTTASDSLLAGLPVLTLPGARFASRVAKGLLTMSGLSSLITTNLQDYEDLAVRLARDQLQGGKLLFDMKEKLKHKTNPLFRDGSAARFVKELENAISSMVEVSFDNREKRAIFL
eukprot:g593.t1